MKRRICNHRTITFWNEARDEDLTLENEFTIDNEGWALLAPFGDSRYTFDAGAGKRVEVIQRITKDTANRMVEAWNSTLSRVKRFFRGGPIYAGHPDRPGFEHLYPDKEVKGLFNELQVRDNGLYVRPIFNDSGAKLLGGPRKLYFSGRWPARQTATLNGLPVYEPFAVTSIGLTPNPNLPTEMLNSKTDGGSSDDGAGAQGTTHQSMNERLKLISALAALKILNLTNDSTDDQVVTEVTNLQQRAATATTLSNEKTTLTGNLAARDSEIADLKKKVGDQSAEFSNERGKLLDHILGQAQTAGTITEADRKVWKGRLERDFANEFPAFTALKPTVKTEADTNASGSRRSPVNGVNEAAAKILSLVNERMPKHPDFETNRAKAYMETYSAVTAENPALVAEAAK